MRQVANNTQEKPHITMELDLAENVIQSACTDTKVVRDELNN